MKKSKSKTEIDTLFNAGKALRRSVPEKREVKPAYMGTHVPNEKRMKRDGMRGSIHEQFMDDGVGLPSHVMAKLG